MAYNVAAYRKTVAEKYASQDHEHVLDAGPANYRYCSKCYENAKRIKKLHSAKGGAGARGPMSKGPGTIKNSRQKRIFYHERALEQLKKGQ